jgi:REP element-mobilizing transposase RayT
MARKLRLEFPGACYHVINRGNYRQDMFATAGAKAAFEQCLFEACQRSHWVLHAFAVMRNHYHLALETPRGNLAAGMQWLQSTYANRFNRFRDEHGHLFQGRYKAILVEEGGPLGAVAHYCHLNPARAGAIAVRRLLDYRYSSYWYVWRPDLRPACLRVNVALAAAGGLTDNTAGWKQYQAFLEWQVASGAAGTTEDRVSPSKGWAFGSDEFKAALLHDHSVYALSRAWEKCGADEIRQQEWERMLGAALRVLGRCERDLETRPPVADWKLAVAFFLKTQSHASNPWLAERLRLGGAKYVSYLMSKLRRTASKPKELAKLQRGLQRETGNREKSSLTP